MVQQFRALILSGKELKFNSPSTHMAIITPVPGESDALRLAKAPGTHRLQVYAYMQGKHLYIKINLKRLSSEGLARKMAQQ